MTSVTNNNTIQAVDSDTGPIIAGPYLSPQQTETLPLKSGGYRKWNLYSCDVEGSLRSVLIFLFGTAGVVTIALLAHLHTLWGIGSRVGGAVVTDNPLCTDIALSALRQGGNAVDGSVAAAFCLSVVHFHIVGLGGGGVFLGYNERSRLAFDVIDFQAGIPAAPSTQNVGVPGLVLGLWEMHQRYGLLSWSQLISPSIELARAGFPVSDSLIKASSCLNLSPANGPLIKLLLNTKEGDNITLPQLADTLQAVSTEGPKVFYNGTIADEIIYTVKVANGSLTRQDLASYQANFAVSERTRFDDFDIIVPASSFGGTFLLNSLETIQTLDLQPDESLNGETVRKLADVMYDTLRILSMKESGQSGALPVGKGKHSSVITITDSNHNLVSVVIGMNSLFGSRLMTEAGFLLNDFVQNGKVQSVGTPILAMQSDELCGQRIVSGGGNVGSLLQVLTQLITFSQSPNSSVEAPRFHIGQTPRSVLLEDLHEPQLSASTIASLQTMQVSVAGQADDPNCPWYDGINVVALLGDEVLPYADSRIHGSAATVAS